MERSAWRASTRGSTGGAVTGGFVTQMVWVTWAPVATSSQVTEYQAPGVGRGRTGTGAGERGTDTQEGCRERDQDRPHGMTPMATAP